MRKPDKSFKKVLDDHLGLMQENVELSKIDTEAAHGYADEQLVELLLFLGQKANCAGKVYEIVSAYEEVDKWYA